MQLLIIISIFIDMRLALFYICVILSLHSCEGITEIDSSNELEYCHENQIVIDEHHLSENINSYLRYFIEREEIVFKRYDSLDNNGNDVFWIWRKSDEHLNRTMNRFVNVPCDSFPNLNQKAVMSHQWSRVRYIDNLYNHRFGFRVGGVEYWVDDKPYTIIGESVESYYEEGGDGRYKYFVYFEFLQSKYEDEDRSEECKQDTKFGDFEISKIKLNSVLTGRDLPEDVQFQLYLSKDDGVELIYDRFSDEIWIKQ